QGVMDMTKNFPFFFFFSLFFLAYFRFCFLFLFYIYTYTHAFFLQFCRHRRGVFVFCPCLFLLTAELIINKLKPRKMCHSISLALIYSRK
ncbi:hypothetical protein QBC42DRAFT_271695, partial [Cladorrhinum samala]